MIFYVYSILDRCAGQYLTPTFEQSDPVAVRNFRHAVMTSGSILTSHRSDFHLFRIGSFDSETGELVSLPTVDHELVCRGGDIDVR